LATIFQTNTFTATTSAQVSGATDNDGNFANLIAVGDVVEMVFAFSGTNGGDTDYAALVFRATGSTEVDFSHGAFGNPTTGSATLGQQTTVAVQEGFGVSTLTSNVTNDPQSLFAGGSNNVAYLLTSDTFNFANKTFTNINSNAADINFVASYALDGGSALVFDSTLKSMNGSSYLAGTGNIEVDYTLKLVQTDVLTAHSGDFGTVDGTYYSIATSSALAGKLTATGFDTTATTHTFTNANNSLEFSTTFAVPEPSSIAVLGCVLVGGLRGRRRRQR
jgi:hypothetical protein